MTPSTLDSAVPGEAAAPGDSAPPGDSAAPGDSARKAALLEAAARIVAEEGVAALSTRRLAVQTGTSTMGVYTWFGNKANLLRAIFREAFDRFDLALRAVPSDGPPLGDLIALGWAYRAHALAHPQLYEVMFGRRASLFEPDDGDAAVAVGTFAILVRAVTRCVDGGELTCSPDSGALQMWAAVHGAVSLELLGDEPGPTVRREVFAGLLHTVLIGLGAAPDAVSA